MKKSSLIETKRMLNGVAGMLRSRNSEFKSELDFRGGELGAAEQRLRGTGTLYATFDGLAGVLDLLANEERVWKSGFVPPDVTARVVAELQETVAKVAALQITPS